MINKDTKLFFSVSSSPGNFGATIYNTLFKEYNINAIYKPLKLVGNKNDFVSFVNSLKIINASGLSVSMPFKKIAKNISWCTHNEAFQIGNCNTLTFENEISYGDNTDFYGFEKACEKILKKVVGVDIYGNGAVSDSIVFVLEKRHIPYRIIKRNDVRLLGRQKNKNCNFLINATPVGMNHIEDNVFTKSIISSYNYIFDVVVNKTPTKLIDMAQNLGKTCIEGKEMSVRQLAKQFEIYTGQRLPIDVFVDIMKEKL